MNFDLATLSDAQKELVRWLFAEADRRAQQHVLTPPYKIEGMHYRAMGEILREMDDKLKHVTN